MEFVERMENALLADFVYLKLPAKIRNCWAHMKHRCYKTTCKAFPSYGGRGIKIHDKWFYNINNFWKWSFWEGGYYIGATKDLQIERLDNDGDYTPENCVWTTQAENLRNRRNVRRLPDGSMLYELAKKNGLKASTVSMRIGHGWPPLLAATMPKHTRLEDVMKMTVEGEFND